MNTEFKAVYKYARVSPKKARLIANLLRGKKKNTSVNAALMQLDVRRNQSAFLIKKTIDSAVANAAHNLFCSYLT